MKTPIAAAVLALGLFTATHAEIVQDLVKSASPPK